MNNLVEAQAAAIASIEANLIEENVHEVFVDLIMPSVVIVKALKASLSSHCISANPTQLIKCSQNNLFVKSVETDKNNIITGFDTTCNPCEAEAFSWDWAEKNAFIFKNGIGEFIAVSERKAYEDTLLECIESVRGTINKLIESKNCKLKSYEEIQGDYMGEFYKINNAVLSD